MASWGRRAAPNRSGFEPPMPSIVSSDVRIRGDLESKGDLQVEGVIEGDVRSRTITIGDAAAIKGNVVGETVHVRGSVTGNLTARSVTLASSARVVGNILHESLAIEPGAYLEGECRHIGTEPHPSGEPTDVVEGMSGEHIDTRQAFSS